MPLIALTGGIGSGKSTIARRLAELGAVIVDADALAREVVEPGTPALAAIKAEFGDAVITSDGSLDRPALARIIFADSDARERLNGIVHPAVVAESKRRFRAALESNDAALVVYDVPLIDARGSTEFESIVVADAPPEIRIARLVEIRGMTEADARARVASQMSDDGRRALAHHVIDTSGTLEHTLEQTEALYARLATPV